MHSSAGKSGPSHQALNKHVTSAFDLFGSLSLKAVRGSGASLFMASCHALPLVSSPRDEPGGGHDPAWGHTLGSMTAISCRSKVNGGGSAATSCLYN